MSGRPDDLAEWLTGVDGDQWVWFAKRLSANDTGQTGAHQVGIYIPGEFALTVAPELADQVLNPRRAVRFTLRSHAQASTPSLTFYNSRTIRGQPNGRAEFRLTGFGGRQSALQDPESTGAILFTAWNRSDAVEAWLATTLDEEIVLENVTGPVEPGTQVTRASGASGRPELAVSAPMACNPDIASLPVAWTAAFPLGQDLTAEAVRRRPGSDHDPDRRLVDRYACEFGLFKVLEEFHTLPLVIPGFRSIDAFLAVAQRVANRRKSRAGRSLELHLAHIFSEENVAYTHGATTEGNRRPDFLFPSANAYHHGLPVRMLGVKTSVKERWRQVLDEAANIPEKHLFTLSEGVSVSQFDQMEQAGIRLVVPASNKTRFPPAVRERLLSLGQFIRLVG